MGEGEGRLPARRAFLLHLNDNHDRNRANVVFGEKAALATSVLNFTLDGIPLLYNGEEVGDSTAPQQQSHVAIRWDIWKPESQRRTSIAGRQKRQTPRVQADHSDAQGRVGAHFRRA